MWYTDAEHFKLENGYRINDTWYPRVTRIIQVKSKPALEHFFREVDSYAAVEGIKNKSAEEGSLIHDVVERILLGQDFDVPLECKAVAKAFEKFNYQHHIVLAPDFVERKIWSLQERYAGTVDGLAFIDGRFGVLDIKTSTGFYPDYNLQTAAYISALRETGAKDIFSLPREVETRWILRIDQCKLCKRCGSALRLKGGRHKVRTKNGHSVMVSRCGDDHDWGETEGVIELKEFPNSIVEDVKAFIAAKTLWEWENNYWLKQIKYLD